MQLKPITAIAVLLLVVASLLVAGCTTSTTSNTNQTPSAISSTATHDAFLEKYLAAQKNVSYADKNEPVNAWELTWINSTSARLEWTVFNKSLNGTWNYVRTFIVFPTTQDATHYLNAMNKTAYSLTRTVYESNGTYQQATGHAPQIYKDYQWTENPSSKFEIRGHEISQLDNIITMTTGKRLS